MKSITLESAALAALDPAPITPDWILAGTPQARSKVLAKSHDRTSSIMVWECTAGRFNWHYGEDETVVIISGEVFITAGKGKRRGSVRAMSDFSLPAVPAHGASTIASKRSPSCERICRSR